MPDEYGGIELEDQWGGVAVEEEPAPPELPEGYTRYVPLPGELEALKAYQPPELRPSTLTPEEIDAGGAALRAQLEAKQRRDWGLEVEAALLAKEQKTDTFGKAITAAPINIATGLEGVGAQLGGILSGVATASEKMPWLPHPISIPPVRRFVKEQGDLMRKEFGELAQENRRDIEGLGQDTAGKAIGRLTETAAGSVPAIPAAILGGIPAAAVVAGGQSFGSTFNEAAAAYEKSGLDKENAESKALLPATVSGVATALITAAGGKTGIESLAKLGGKEAVAALGAKNLKDVAASVLKNFGAEAIEEGSDQLAQAITQKVTYNPNLTFGDVIDQVSEAAVMGGVLGGTAGGIVSGIEARRAMVPPEIRARIEQAKQTLPKAAAAAEEAVVKGQDVQKAEAKAPVEEGAGVGLRQEAPAQEAPLKPRLVPVLETASGKLYPGPSHTKAAEAARAKINSDFAEGKITREEFIKELTEVLEADEAVDTQHKMLDLNTGKTVEQGPGRVQSFNLDPKETAANLRELQDKGIAAPKVEVAGQMIDRINQLPVEEAVKLNQRPEMYRELGLKPEDASALQKASDNAFARFEAFLDAGNEAAAQAEMGRGVFFNGAIEWANKKGPNYERGIAETAAPKEAPTPQLAAQGVGAIPENVPTARPATAQEGVGGSQKQPWQMSNDEFFDKVVSQRSSVVTTEGKVITGTDHGDARLRAEEMGLNVGKGEELGQRAGWKAFGQNILASELETGAARKRIIEQALKEGKPVPPEVLADYPNLQAVRQSESPQRAAAFFERESEAQGLGRSSLPSTVEDVRVQRARDEAAPSRENVSRLAEQLADADMKNWLPETSLHGDGYNAYSTPTRDSAFSEFRMGKGLTRDLEGGSADVQGLSAYDLERIRATKSQQVIQLLGEDAGLKWLANVEKFGLKEPTAIERKAADIKRAEGHIEKAGQDINARAKVAAMIERWRKGGILNDSDAALLNAKLEKRSEPPARSYFNRQSEAQGLGELSTPPTVADVRAARPAAQWQLKPDPEAKHRQIVISKSGSNLGTVGLTPKGDWRVFGDPSPKRFKSAEAAADQLITDLHPGLGKQNPYFDRQSEAQGLGELSTPPTVADVRAQRARDTGAPPPVEPPKPSAAASPAPGPRGTLDDVYGIFETDPKPSPTIKQRVIKASEAFRTGLSSSFRPLNKLVEDVAKQYGLPLKKADLSGLFEQLKGSSGKAEADIYRFDQDVSKLVKGSEKDFNAHLFLRRSLDRLEQDAARGETRRAVSGYTIPELQSKLATLEAKLTPEQRASFKTAADSFQRHMDEALKLQVDSGRMSPEVYTAIKEGNQFYAPFKVMKYLEETARPAGTGRRIDTPASFVKAMEGIESPDFKLGDMLAAARQNISLSRVLAEKNKAMQNFTDLAALDTEGLFLKKLKSGQEAPQGMEAVNVFENGVQERYVVNPDVATAVQVHGPQSGTLLARIAGNIFRAGATTFNLPFQVSNLMADIPRQALVSKYGLRGVTDLVRYPLDFAESVFSSFAGNFGIKNKLYLDFLDSGVAGSTVQQYLTPDALRFKPETAQSKTKAFAKSVLNTIPEFTNAIEQVSKIVGVKRAMRFEGKETGAQLAREIPEAITEIRRFSGSPDFGRSGKWTDQARLNLLYMFFNARVQGTIADVGRLTGRDGAGMARKTWFKVGTAIGLPTVYVYLMNNSDEYKEDYAKRPEQEKRNYWLIPKDSFITNSTGEKMRDYWRIPKRESAKWVGNFVEAGMEFAQERDPKHFAEWGGTMLEEVFPVNIQGDTAQQRLESMGASLNPVIKAPLEVATGRDMYRHRNIVPKTMEKASPELQYTDRTAEVFKKLGEAMPDVAPEVFRSPLMLENMTKNMTAGLITQFLPRKPVEGRSDLENTPLGARFQAVPYTDSSEFDERMDKLERETADEQLTRFRNADKLLKENKDAGLKVLVQKSIAAHGPDRKQVEKVVDLWTAEQRGITPQERRIMALPTQQRAEFIIGELTGKTPEQRAALIRTYAIKRILTEGVAEQMIAQGFK